MDFCHLCGCLNPSWDLLSVQCSTVLDSVDRLTLSALKAHHLLDVQIHITSCQMELFALYISAWFCKVSSRMQGKIHCEVSRFDEVTEVKMILCGYIAKTVQHRTDWI